VVAFVSPVRLPERIALGRALARHFDADGRGLVDGERLVCALFGESWPTRGRGGGTPIYKSNIYWMQRSCGGTRSARPSERVVREGKSRLRSERDYVNDFAQGGMPHCAIRPAGLKDVGE
jgi:hypothetical protein